jgi:hypothetical protein
VVIPDLMRYQRSTRTEIEPIEVISSEIPSCDRPFVPRFVQKVFQPERCHRVLRGPRLDFWRGIRRLEQELTDATRHVHLQLAKVALAAVDCR